MSLSGPILDNRSYEQIRDELIRRIPVYAQEWTDHNASDPGITLIELFAFLGENLLYRFNQIPESTRLEYLRLLHIPPRPARQARAMVSLTTKTLEGVRVPQRTELKAGSLPFETVTEVRVLPVSCRAVCKSQRALPDAEREPEAFEYFQRSLDAIDGLDDNEQAASYANESVAEDGSDPPVDFDRAVDGMLWIAVLSTVKDDNDSVRESLIEHEQAPLLLNVGFVPDLTAPPSHQVTPCPGDEFVAPAPEVQWQISTGRFTNGDDLLPPVFKSLQVRGDTTRGLTQQGIVRIEFPRDLSDVGVFDLDDQDRAGSGDLPPQLDDETSAKVLFWIRAFRRDESRFGKVKLISVNAAEAEQSRQARAEFLGTGTGQPGQIYQLIHAPVVDKTLSLQVEGPEGWQDWERVDEFHASTESDLHYVLDSASGEVRFGNGLQGYAPQIGQRIRARTYRYGGGEAGNVPAGAISKIPAFPSVKVQNPLRARDGADGETIEKAIARIPGELRRRDRAVTMGDFRELALATPGADLGRAECLPRYYPPARTTPAAENVPGIVTVIVWPRRDAKSPNAPRPDRTVLRAVCKWLDQRRLVTTELYVVPPVYRQIAVSVGLQVKPGYGIDAVRAWVELVLRQYLAPLPPYGPSGEGWPLGRRVHGPELEAAALQVEGVEFLEGLEVAQQVDNEWVTGTVELELDEVPELLVITVVEGPPAPAGSELSPPTPGKTPVPIPVIKQEC